MVVAEFSHSMTKANFPRGELFVSSLGRETWEDVQVEIDMTDCPDLPPDIPLALVTGPLLISCAGTGTFFYCPGASIICEPSQVSEVPPDNFICEDTPEYQQNRQDLEDYLEQVRAALEVSEGTLDDEECLIEIPELPDLPQLKLIIPPPLNGGEQIKTEVIVICDKEFVTIQGAAWIKCESNCSWYYCPDARVIGANPLYEDRDITEFSPGEMAQELGPGEEEMPTTPVVLNPSSEVEPNASVIVNQPDPVEIEEEREEGENDPMETDLPELQYPTPIMQIRRTEQPIEGYGRSVTFERANDVSSVIVKPFVVHSSFKASFFEHGYHNFVDYLQEPPNWDVPFGMSSQLPLELAYADLSAMGLQNSSNGTGPITYRAATANALKIIQKVISDVFKDGSLSDNDASYIDQYISLESVQSVLNYLTILSVVRMPRMLNRLLTVATALNVPGYEKLFSDDSSATAYKFYEWLMRLQAARLAKREELFDDNNYRGSQLLMNLSNLFLDFPVFPNDISDLSFLRADDKSRERVNLFRSFFLNLVRWHGWPLAKTTIIDDKYKPALGSEDSTTGYATPAMRQFAIAELKLDHLEFGRPAQTWGNGEMLSRVVSRADDPAPVALIQAYRQNDLIIEVIDGEAYYDTGMYEVEQQLTSLAPLSNLTGGSAAATYNANDSGNDDKFAALRSAINVRVHGAQVNIQREMASPTFIPSLGVHIGVKVTEENKGQTWFIGVDDEELSSTMEPLKYMGVSSRFVIHSSPSGPLDPYKHFSLSKAHFPSLKTSNYDNYFDDESLLGGRSLSLVNSPNGNYSFDNNGARLTFPELQFDQGWYSDQDQWAESFGFKDRSSGNVDVVATDSCINSHPYLMLRPLDGAWVVAGVRFDRESAIPIKLDGPVGTVHHMVISAWHHHVGLEEGKIHKGFNISVLKDGDPIANTLSVKFDAIRIRHDDRNLERFAAVPSNSQQSIRLSAYNQPYPNVGNGFYAERNQKIEDMVPSVSEISTMLASKAANDDSLFEALGILGGSYLSTRFSTTHLDLSCYIDYLLQLGIDLDPNVPLKLKAGTLLNLVKNISSQDWWAMNIDSSFNPWKNYDPNPSSKNPWTSITGSEATDAAFVIVRIVTELLSKLSGDSPAIISLNKIKTALTNRKLSS